MLVEVAFALTALRLFELAGVLRLAMDETIDTRALLVALTLGAPAYRPQIDHFPHSASRY
jgi:hypothetical protein